MTDLLDSPVDEPATDVSDAPPTKRQPAANPTARTAAIAAVVALTALAGWLGFRAHQAHQMVEQREQFLQVGRQGAINLTTIDYTDADADVQRVLDSATGTFYTDFATRSQPFLNVVKQTKSTTVGTVTAAGIESSTGAGAQILVAVTVKTSKSGVAQPQPRYWRMRLSVQKVGEQAKVSNVEFVP